MYMKTKIDMGYSLLVQADLFLLSNQADLALLVHPDRKKSRGEETRRNKRDETR